MPRPPHPRRVGRRIDTEGFRPIGRPVRGIPTITLGLDELEAIRLADLEGLYQEAGAERMGVSRQTFARILARAHAKVAGALIEGKVLLVGEAPVVPEEAGPSPCPVHWGGRRRGRRCRCGGGDGEGQFGGGRGRQQGSREPKGE